MFLIVGLGNPGAKYLENRHNIGFKAVDSINHRFSFSGWSEKFAGLVSKGEIDNHKVILLKPSTYMNNSGESVQKALAFFKITPENMIVIHDELDLPPLKMRYKIGGGNGGHNGLKCIQEKIGTADFNRLRIGIGHPGVKDRVSSYVLSNFASSEKDSFQDLCDEVSKNISLILKGNSKKFISEMARLGTKQLFFPFVYPCLLTEFTSFFFN
jgi:PTH1 family peptidyl-tRNA hydrolase